MLLSLINLLAEQHDSVFCCFIDCLCGNNIIYTKRQQIAHQINSNIAQKRFNRNFMDLLKLSRDMKSRGPGTCHRN